MEAATGAVSHRTDRRPARRVRCGRGGGVAVAPSAPCCSSRWRSGSSPPRTSCSSPTTRPTARPSTTSAPVTVTTAPKPAGPYKVTTGVNIRQGPGTTFPSVGTIETGRQVFVSCVIDGQPVDGPSGPITKWLRLTGFGPTGYLTVAYVDVGDDLNVAGKIPPCPRPDRRGAQPLEVRERHLRLVVGVVVHGHVADAHVDRGRVRLARAQVARVDRVRSARDLDADAVAGGEPVPDGPERRRAATNTPSASRVMVAGSNRCSPSHTLNDAPSGCTSHTRTKKSTWSSVDVTCSSRRHRSDELERLRRARRW